VTLLVAPLLVVSVLWAQGADPARLPASPELGVPSVVEASRTSERVTVDGRLDEPLWQTARPITRFVQRDPAQGAPPSERTEVVLAFDAEALYVGARLHDSDPGAIVSRLARRDRQVNADGFIVYLDAHRDRRSGAYFGLNAAGTKYDGTLSNDDWSDDSWDGVWEGAAAVGPQGWTAEMRIPLSQLRFSRQPRVSWGINFERIIARKNEHDLLVYTPRKESGFVSRFLALELGDELAPPRRIELLPYLSLRSDYFNHSAESPLRDTRMPLTRAGADVKVGIGGNLTLDATVYPDFGQVEVDPAVVNLSDVEVFFPERRPFFIEGADVFQAFGRGGSRSNWNFNWPGSDIVYGRRIGRSPQRTLPDHDYVDAPPATDIIGAAKLTGKIGSWNLGTLHALTDRESARIVAGGVESELPVEPLTYYGATRVQREIDGGRQGLGLIATTTARRLTDPGLASELSSTAGVFGLDGWSFLDRDRMFVLTGWAAASRVQGTAERITALQESSVHYFQRPDASHVEVDPQATALSGWAGRLALNKQKGNVLLNVGAGALSPGWEVNDLGFGAFSDVINGHVAGGYQWPDPGKVFRRVQLMGSTFSSWDFGGHHTTQGFWTNFNPEFLNFWSGWLGGVLILPTLNPRQTRGGPLTRTPAGAEGNIGFATDDRKAWRIDANFSVGGEALDSNHRWSINGALELRPADRFVLRLEPSWSVNRNSAQYLDTVDDLAAVDTYGKRYLFGDLHQKTFSANVRLSWIFSPNLSFEFFGQPLVSSVRYDRVRALARPRTHEFLPTDMDPNEHDFTFASLRGSAVLRWEYLPGSTLYLVWNHNRSVEEERLGRFRPGRSYDALADARSDHIVMVKASYWWSP
jgi:hypothetical protein